MSAAQGTPEWHKERLGKVTASRVSDVIARTKSGYGASRADYMAELISERLTGVPYESATNAAMRWGTEIEPQARAAYAFLMDADVIQAGFIPHPQIAMSGASPDGFIGDDGLIEIKCPQTKTHIDTLLGRAVPGRYFAQIQWQLACTGRTWCDFVSFDPRMPAELRMFVKRVERDDSKIGELTTEIEAFLAEIETKIEALTKLAA
jgi:putative phage-type endonuclease